MGDITDDDIREVKNRIQCWRQPPCEQEEIPGEHPHVARRGDFAPGDQVALVVVGVRPIAGELVVAAGGVARVAVAVFGLSKIVLRVVARCTRVRQF
jgi:hypothetical protein